MTRNLAIPKEKKYFSIASGLYKLSITFMRKKNISKEGYH